MSQLKATPGPWQWFPSVSQERPAVIDTAAGVDSTNGTVVAEVMRGKQYEANANLIAAAPELYEALEEADGAWADAAILIAHSDPKKQRKAKEALYAWRDKAKAALARARGEAS